MYMLGGDMGFVIGTAAEPAQIAGTSAFEGT